LTEKSDVKYVNIILHFKDVKYINQSVGDWTYTFHEFIHTSRKKSRLRTRVEILIDNYI
jgi:hypothetical protein